jgi:hypothetical protein
VSRREDYAPPVLLLTLDQAAEACQVSRAQLDEWSFRSGFPVIREGRMVRVPLADLEVWLSQQALPDLTMPARLPLRRHPSPRGSLA